MARALTYLDFANELVTVLIVVKTAILDTPTFGTGPHRLLNGLGPSALSRVSTALAGLFDRQILPATLFQGERAEPSGADLTADLNDLAKALGEAGLSRDPELCDQYSGDPAPLTLILQLEGLPPARLAVLTPSSDEAAAEAVSEAAAMGFILDGGTRPIALKPPPPAPPPAPPRTPRGGPLRLEVNAMANWDDLAALAPAHAAYIASLAPCFSSPLEAARQGAVGAVAIAEAFDRPWRFSFSLPPRSSGISERTWLFADAQQAAETARRVATTYQPFLVETFPLIDGSVLAAAGMSRKATRFEETPRKGAALRLVATGPAVVRRPLLLSASWGIEKDGGVCHWRAPLEGRRHLGALAVASGCARVEREGDNRLPTPAEALFCPRVLAIKGAISEREVLWYPRDLDRSVAELCEVMGLPPSVDTQGREARRAQSARAAG
ncbi:hypothetical protein PB2503_10009 [Parvularcula bermudensis HTCC2503]|uniref:Uncharacterized protein n=1 Tax=Parvularcula bermudensis (strain ATCC BAA-594 / HTCC2503 / KCTC 12087) TaxID=314260 RepID=E0TEW1_PARBH|nr:hypothetical protein [Parvularcula bermudensis]ADM10054.1 hypothetical protein PB2503_10009 [Parvularcula bermudensis HTCC2503]